MKILVCISSVPDTTSKINFIENNTKLDTSGMQFVINPYDEFGLTKAMMLKESNQAEVTVITVGDINVEPVMRKALAIGADKAVRINTKPNDSFSVANEIAMYIKNNSFDLIIGGRESIDYNGGAVPGMISEMLNLPFINACINLEIKGSEVEATREIEGGKEIVSVSLPLIIGGQKGLVEEDQLRIPNMRGIMTARTKTLEVIDPSSTETYTSTEKFEPLKEKASCKIVDSNNIDKLIEILSNEAKVI